MRLPDISYGGVTDEESPALARAGAATGRLADVVQQGLTAFGQELVKTQSQQAAVDLTRRLDKIETDLHASPFVPLSALKGHFGEDLADLDPAVRGQVEKMAASAPPAPAADYDPTEGPLRSKGPDPLIPTWAVAGSIYQKQAADALGESSKAITVPGWQSAFRTHAMADIVARQGRMAELQAKGLLEYLGKAHEQQISDATAAGNFGLARSILGNSEAIRPERKVELAHHVGLLEDTRPAYDAMRMITSPVEAIRNEGLERVDAELKRVNDPAAYTHLQAKDREVLAHELRAASQAYHAVRNQRDAAKIAMEYVEQARDARNPMRVNPELAFDQLDEDFKARRFARREELWPEIRRVLQEHIKDRNEAAKLALGNVQGDAMGEFMGLDEQGVPHLSFSNLQPETIRQLHRFGKDGEATLEQLVKWDAENAERARRLGQLPSLEQSEKALAIELDVARHPGKWRRLATQPGEIFGRLTGTVTDPDLPGGAVSQKDLPELSKLIASHTRPAETRHVSDAHTIAIEEAGNVYKGLRGKNPSKAPEDERKAYHLLKDKLDTFVNAHRDEAGNDPPDADVRGEAQRLLRDDIEVRDSFLLIPYTRKTSRIQHEVDTGKPPIEPSATPAPGATPAPAATPAPTEPVILRGPPDAHGRTLYRIPKADFDREYRPGGRLDPSKWSVEKRAP